MNQPEILLKKLSPSVLLPAKAHETDVGYDLCAHFWEGTQLKVNVDWRMSLSALGGVVIAPRETLLIPLGFAVEIPIDWEIQVRSRSGLAAKGVHVLNSPGTVDPGYRGEMGVLLHNAGSQPYMIKQGDRVAQAVISPRYACTFTEVSELADSPRGEGGFGSTGQARPS